jgi:glutamine synthetase
VTSVLALEGLETIALAVPDNIGRLIGKRIPAERYEEVTRSGLSMPDFHLVTGVKNTPIEGLAVTGAHTGFRNGVLRPDESTLRLLPWHEATALVLCNPYDPDGRPSEVAPRWVLRRQLERLGALGLEARCATELEFYLYRGTYEKHHRLGYRKLEPSYHLHGDNDLLVAGYDEALMADIRRLMPQAGIPVEVSHGEGGAGQHEIALEKAAPLESADRHVVYKHGVKELAARHALAATFMAKVRDDEPGSSCHVHISIADGERSALANEAGALTPFGRSFLSGLLAHTPELMLLHAPYSNSYRRLVKGSWAPANLTWGYDNRTCCVRVLGSGRNFRFEFRTPGADANPYLSLAAIFAAGLAGVERGLDPPPAETGDAYAVNAPDLPGDIGEAVTAFAASELAASVFGAAVRDHFAAIGAAERDECRRAVTDVDLRRGFERA